jgi:pyruvate-formate lyase-activating enzyme
MTSMFAAPLETGGVFDPLERAPDIMGRQLLDGDGWPLGDDFGPIVICGCRHECDACHAPEVSDASNTRDDRTFAGCRFYHDFALTFSALRYPNGRAPRIRPGNNDCQTGIWKSGSVTFWPHGWHASFACMPEKAAELVNGCFSVPRARAREEGAA